MRFQAKIGIHSALCCRVNETYSLRCSTLLYSFFSYMVGYFFFGQNIWLVSTSRPHIGAIRTDPSRGEIVKSLQKLESFYCFTLICSWPCDF